MCHVVSSTCLLFHRVSFSQGVAVAQPGYGTGHVVFKWSHLSLHHHGHKSAGTVCDTRRDSPSGETERHEPSVLEARISLKNCIGSRLNLLLPVLSPLTVLWTPSRFYAKEVKEILCYCYADDIEPYISFKPKVETIVNILFLISGRWWIFLTSWL